MIDLLYANNVTRVKVGEVTAETINVSIDLLDDLLYLFAQSDRIIEPRPENLRILINGIICPLDLKEFPLPDGSAILYCEIIPPNSAYHWDLKDGIEYYFHYNEKPHEHNPHIHARIKDGGKISIYLKDFHTVGRFKNAPKKTVAVKYVKMNYASIMKEWETNIAPHLAGK